MARWHIGIYVRLVEDNAQPAKALADGLRERGYEGDIVETAEQAISAEDREGGGARFVVTLEAPAAQTPGENARISA